ncbi:MAG: NYN domain-containing protein [Micrococcales bacterium]|nr:NYN domain-containing protein [Micrococcales bacterium]
MHVFRGAASNHENALLYASNQAQRSEWTRDRRVSVEYRTLKYFTQRGVRIAQEKGIDVRVALDFTRMAATSAAEVVILCTHDTDLEPALDAAFEWVALSPKPPGGLVRGYFAAPAGRFGTLPSTERTSSSPEIASVTPTRPWFCPSNPERMVGRMWLRPIRK